MFVAGWLLLFLGHRIEGNKPAVFQGAIYFLVGPIWVLKEIKDALFGTGKSSTPTLVKANPNLDPNRMRVGTTVILPDLKDIKTGPAQTASARIAGSSPAAAINPQKQYRVVAGDSMYKISVKLYGNSSMSGKIYDANKQMIGDDPAKLKVGQVLQLPEPPTRRGRPLTLKKPTG